MDTLAQWLAQVAAAGGLTLEEVLAAKASAAPTSPPTASASTLGPPSDWAYDSPLLQPGEAHRGFHCAVCRDARFVRREVPVGHPDFGRALPCSCTTDNAAVIEARRWERIQASGLPAGLRLRTLDTLEPVPGLTPAITAMREAIAVQQTGGEASWVALFGTTGCGKSHLLASAANALLTRQQVRYWTVPELLAACQARGIVDGHPQAFAEDSALTAEADRAAVLVLDEVGSQLAGDWGREKLERLVNRRYEARRPLFLGLNCTAEELKAWSPRIASRLGDRSLCRVVAITAGDYRPRLRREEVA